MGLRINTNVDAFNAHRTLGINSSKLSKSMERLASGFRINRASDDAAGLGISERMRGQIRGLAQAQRNAQDGISMANTADGALGEIHSMLQRIRELAVQHSNGTNDAAALNSIEEEGLALVQEINRVVAGTSFAGVNVIDSTTATTLQVGANAGETITVTAVDADGATGANTTALAAMFPAGAGNGTMDLGVIDDAIAGISAMRGQWGAVANRLEYTINSLGIAQENMMAAESRIRDVDMAQEMTNFSRLQILQESGIAMLAQANMSQSSVLSLLK